MISNKPQKLSLDGIKVEIYETLSSTQTLLLERAQPSLCLVARHQSHGIGSRGNTWESVKEGIYFSLALNKEELPSDLALQSASIYFGFCFKEVINELGVEVWLKWPNDIYIGEKKAGGVMVSVKSEIIICGIGLNFFSSDSAFGALGRRFDELEILDRFFKKIKKATSWKEIFSKYKIEFYKNFGFSFHHQNHIIEFKDATLLEDGALLVGCQKIYSSR